MNAFNKWLYGSCLLLGCKFILNNQILKMLLKEVYFCNGLWEKALFPVTAKKVIPSQKSGEKIILSL